MKRLFPLYFLVLFGYSAQAQTVDFNFSTPNGTYCNSQLVTFTAQASGNPSSFLWTFGDGQVGYTANQTILYIAPGTYNVTLTVVYASNAISISKTVTIYPTPTVSLTSNTTTTLCTPGNIVFTATTNTPISTYQWNFGDGNSSTTTAASTNHTYAGFGNFITTVTAVTANGCTAQDTVITRINQFPISGYVSPPYGCIPNTATLVVQPFLFPGDAIQNVTWNFGDGSTPVNSTVNFINHVYNTTNLITTAAATVTSTAGCTNTFTFPPLAYGTPSTDAQINTSDGRNTYCGSETISFSATASHANQYSWDFGDGSAIVNQSDTSITHTYSDIGVYNVIVTPFFNGCAGTPDTLTINVVGVIARFLFANNCNAKNTYSFTNNSFGNVDHFEWTFSDMPGFIDSTNLNPVHSFPTNGSYTATLRVVDSLSGCADTLTAFIYTALPQFSSSSNLVCKDSLVSFSVTQTYAANSGRNYEFHINNTILNNGTDSVLNYYPNLHGSFTNFVVISGGAGNTCNDTLYLAQPTRVRGPIAGFTVNPSSCIDTAVNFTNNAYPFNIQEPITSYQWNFGDSSFSNQQNPTPHLYNLDDSFYVIQTVADANGCAQSDTQQVIIRPLPIVVAFPANDTLCLNDSLELRVYSADSIFWRPHPDINCTSNCDTVVVVPTQPTQYIVGTQSAFGCRNFDTINVQVYRPFNLAVSPADTIICPGQPVPLSLNALGNISWQPATYLSSTNIPNPIATPADNITYTAIVQDLFGCFSDTAQANIQIHSLPTVDAGPDLELPYNSSFTLHPQYSSGINNYTWSPPGNLSCINCPNPSGLAIDKILYTIDVSDVNGCKASDSLWVSITCEKSSIYVPNAFTPNNDGLNDYFYPITFGYSNIKSFSVFNRFGNRVFFRKNFAPNSNTLGWDGTFKNNKYLSTQSFVWIVEAVCFSGEIITKKGMVTLIR